MKILKHFVFIALVVFFSSTAAVLSADPPFGKSPVKPIAELLKADGTLDLSSGYNGSLDVSGYHMILDKSGNPVFLQNAGRSRGGNPPVVQADDDNWDSEFILPGVNANVYSIATNSSGYPYIGGNFNYAGGVDANAIAYWDGNAWAALGTGVGGGSGACWAVAVNGTDVYAGGYFSTPGKNIAHWNGSSWSAMGSGLSGGSQYVEAIAVYGTTVYAGGRFTASGATSLPYIAKWNGSSWSGLGTGLNGFCYALAVDGSGNLYAGGAFTTAGGLTVNRIAKWDGSNWSALGALGSEGLTGGNCLSISIDASNNVYAGGAFTTAGGAAAARIAKWDGASWSTLGSGISGGDVEAVMVRGSTVYAGGAFTTAGGVAVNRIAAATWNGSIWSWAAMGDGADNTVMAIAGSSVYVGGAFRKAGTIAAAGISHWSGANWYGVCSNASNGLFGSSPKVYAVAVSGSDVYVGGHFSGGGILLADNIAKWTNDGWVDMAGGIGTSSSSVYAIAVYGGNVYAGGTFSEAGGVTVSNLAVYDGSSWADVGGGSSGTVYSLAFDGSGNLYAGGAFTEAGGTPANGIAVWDGADWSAMGDGLTGGSVYAIAFDGSGNVFTGGDFTDSGSTPVSCVAEWTGAAWTDLGGGMNAGGAVHALVFYGTDLIAGGNFYAAGSVSADNLASWSGSAWSELGGGADAPVYALQVGGGLLTVAGAFTYLNDITSANGIASWNGAAWTVYGSGVDMTDSPAVYALGLGSVYLGGDFTTVGAKKSFCFAKYITTSTATVQVAARIFLQGPYDAVNDNMKISLNTAGYVPVTAPYTGYQRTVPTIPANAVDWVLVQLRASASGPAVSSKSAFLNRDGRLVADDGTTAYVTLEAAAGDYFIVIKHRNHLTAMSSVVHTLASGSSTEYNFTSAETQFYGSGGAKQVETGVWGMVGGNAVNTNQAVILNDYMTIKAAFGQRGYLATDTNMSGAITIQDYMLTKANFGKSSPVPSP
jgi:hypothetical protein